MPLSSSTAVDPAILKALDVPSTSSSKLLPHGGSGFAASSNLTIITTAADDKDTQDTTRPKTTHYFVKTGTGLSSEVMFRGEHASLNAIHSAVPSLCPKSHAHGTLSSSPSTYFLVTDFLDLNPTSLSTAQSLAQKLATLHSTPAPTPSGFTKPMFGFPVTTCCGSTEQDNSWKESWAEFYADNRLRRVLRQGIEQRGVDKALSEAVETVAAKVVPRLLGDGHLKGVVPVVVHGDLWSGNHGRGRIGGGDGKVEEVVYDPSSVYGHSEYELGIMKMFGGFGGGFWSEYGRLVGKSEPVAEWEDRVALYEL